MQLDGLKDSGEFIRNRTAFLISKLEEAIATTTLEYDEVSKVVFQGLYIIFEEGEVLYVSKTNRKGKVRLRELAADFRSHTLNRKLLSKRFRDLGFVFKVLTNKTKKDWIEKDLFPSTILSFIKVKLIQVLGGISNSSFIRNSTEKRWLV